MILSITVNLHRRIAGIPLGWVIAIPLVVSASGAVAGVGYLAYYRGQIAMEGLGEQLVEQTNDLISEEITSYLEIPQLINQLNVDTVQRGALDPKDEGALEALLFQRLQQFDQITTILFAGPDGTLRVAERYPEWRVVIAEPSQPDRLMIYHLKPDGSRGALLSTETGFDVRRDRPWYQQAVIHGGPRWSPIAQHGPSDYLTLTASQPVYDPTTGDLLGVFAVQTRLAYLSEILRQFNLSADSRILITDSAGTLIGISSGERLYSVVGGTGLRKRFQQQTLTTSQDSLIQALGEQFRVLEGQPPRQPSPITTGNRATPSQRDTPLTIDGLPRTFSFPYQRQRQFVKISPIRDADGLDWRIITLVPESHFLGEIQRQHRQALLLWLLSLGGALGLGVLAAKLLLNRLAQFSQASQLLAEGDLNQRLATDSPIAELNGLARSFNQMADQLQAAFDQLQTALDESEAKFSSIFRFNPDPIAITSYAEGRFLDVNRSELDFFGYHRDEMIGRTALELNLWTDLTQRQYYRTLLEQEGRVQGLEIQVTTKAGEIRTILFSAKRQLLEGQDCIIGAHQDITELKQTEAKLQQSQQWLNQYSQLSPGNIYTLVSQPDGSMKFEYVSAAVETIHEITVEQALADAGLILNTFHPDDLPGYEAAAQECLQTLNVLSHQFRIITPSGRVKWLDVRSQPEVRPNGVIAWHGIAIDITERIQAAEALRASEERFRQLAETVKEGFFVYEMATDQYSYINPAHGDILGLTLQQIRAGMANWFDRIHPDDQEGIRAALERERQGENFDQEYRYITPDGELRWLRSKAFPLCDETGKVVRVVGTVENITERKQTEAALHQSEAQKQAILNALPDLIIRMRRDGTYLDIQPTATFPTELPSFEVGANIRQVLHPPVLTMYLDAMESALQSGIAQVCEYPIWVRGQQLWQEVRIVPLLADEVLFVIRDLTGRHRMELALRQSQQQLAMAQRVAQVGYWEFDLITRKVTWSRATFNHWGFDPTQPEPSYEEFLQRVYPDDRPNLETIVATAITHGTPYQIDLRALHPNGDIRYLDARGEAVYNGQGQVVKLVGASTDITERKRTEDALRESEERFRRAFDDAPHGISLVLANGQFIKANAYLCNLLGYSEAELLNLTFLDVTYSEDREPDWRLFQDMMAGKISTCQVEKRYITKHGNIIPVQISAAPIYDEAGHPLYSIGHAQDIRERLAIDRMKDEFISIVSHELRTPITSIQGALMLLGAGVYSTRPEQAGRMLDIAIKNSARLVHLVDDILSFERLESGKVQLAQERCEVASLMYQAIETIQPMADQSGITIAVTPIAATLWAAPDEIIQVLTNLLSNAVKFSSSGKTVWLSADVKVEEVPTGPPAHRPTSRPAPLPAHYLLFTVTDQGRGIPADRLDLIFKEFQQVDVSDSRKKGGTGLGLAICRRIVERHQGHIWVKSCLGAGSTFYVALPLDPGEGHA